jgi:rhodanese-related sulfurtransferase
MRGLHCLKPLTNWNNVNFIQDNLLTIAVAVVSGGALLVPALMPRGKRATTLEVTQLINRGKTVVVDIRTPEEFANGHLRDAKNIPLADFGTRIGELDKSKGKSVVVVCQTGARVDKAIKQLQAAGFEDVVGLDGGIAAWQAASLPTVK